MVNEFKKQFPDYNKDSKEFIEFDEEMDKNFINIKYYSSLMKNDVASLDCKNYLEIKENKEIKTIMFLGNT